MRRFVELVAVMAERYLKVRYRGSSLGVAWSLLNPLVMTGVYTVVFGHAFGHYYGASTFDYLFALFIGFVVVNYFQTSTTQALHSVVANGALMNKMHVPAGVFPVATVAANTTQFLFTVVPALAILTVVLSHNPLMLLILPFPIVALALVTLGVSLVTSAAYVYFRDVPHLYELVSFLIFIATPVFYPLVILSPSVRPFIQWLPLSLIVEQLRAAVILNRMPTLASFLVIALWAIVVALAGWGVFAWARLRFLEKL